MRIKLSVGLALLMSGCATVGDVRDRPAVFEGASQKTVQEIAACVSSKWMRMRGLTLNSVPIDNGLALTLGWTYYSSPITELVLDIVDIGPRRSATLRSRFKSTKPEAVRDLSAQVAPCL